METLWPPMPLSNLWHSSAQACCNCWAAPLPSDDSAVTITRGDLVALLEEDKSGTWVASTRDLTVEEVADETHRAPSTVRGWLLSGALRGFKLNNRDWRVPRTALREVLST